MDQRKTISLDRGQALVRLFHWGWGTYPTDTCKLAWGVIFIPLAALFNLLDFTLGNLFRPLFRAFKKKWFREPRTAAEWEAYWAARDARRAEDKTKQRVRKTKQERRRARLKQVMASMEWLANIFRFVCGWSYWYVVGWAIIGAFILGAIGGIIWLTTLPNFWGALLEILITIAIAAGVIAVVVAVVCGIVVIDDRHNGLFKRFFNRLGDVLTSAYHSFHNRTCARVDVSTPRSDGGPRIEGSYPLGSIGGHD